MVCVNLSSNNIQENWDWTNTRLDHVYRKLPSKICFCLLSCRPLRNYDTTFQLFLSYLNEVSFIPTLIQYKEWNHLIPISKKLKKQSSVATEQWSKLQSTVLPFFYTYYTVLNNRLPVYEATNCNINPVLLSKQRDLLYKLLYKKAGKGKAELINPFMARVASEHKMEELTWY